MEITLTIAWYPAGGDRLFDEAGKQFVEGLSPAGEQSVGLPGLRYTTAGIWCGRENIPVDDDDLRESIVSAHAARSPAMLAPITTAWLPFVGSPPNEVTD